MFDRITSNFEFFNLIVIERYILRDLTSLIIVVRTNMTMENEKEEHT